jgi:hypothetical protein
MLIVGYRTSGVMALCDYETFYAAIFPVGGATAQSPRERFTTRTFHIDVDFSFFSTRRKTDKTAVCFLCTATNGCWMASSIATHNMILYFFYFFYLMPHLEYVVEYRRADL